ncbi:MAG: molybdenum cofactor guanylyltransferase [Treponema sp.]|nr:molybdenum cofactor guanylyltransferase [Treponema sp.]
MSVIDKADKGDEAETGAARWLPRTAAILAGGRGSRLGGMPKESILVDGEELGPRLVRLLSTVFQNIIVITNNKDLYAGTGAFAASDAIPGFGPLSGLHAALSLAPGPSRDGGAGEAVWLAACDMPAFDPRLVELLASRYAEAVAKAASGNGAPPLAALARHGGHFEPFHAIYSTRLVGELEGLFADDEARAGSLPRGGRFDLEAKRPSFKELFARVPVLFVAEAEVRTITPDWGLYFNVNTPEELARLPGHGGDRTESGE